MENYEMADAEFTISGITFQLEEFDIAGECFNFVFKGSGGRNQYIDNQTKEYFVYINGEELELVKNFLTTIRG